MANEELLLLAVIIGALLGIIYSLKRILVLERRIGDMEQTIAKNVGRRRTSRKK